MFATLHSSGLKIFYEGATFNGKSHYFFQMWGVFCILLTPYPSLAELVLGCLPHCIIHCVANCCYYWLQFLCNIVNFPQIIFCVISL